MFIKLQTDSIINTDEITHIFLEENCKEEFYHELAMVIIFKNNKQQIVNKGDFETIKNEFEDVTKKMFEAGILL